MPVKQSSGIKKSGRVFGHRSKRTRTIARAGLYAQIAAPATSRRKSPLCVNMSALRCLAELFVLNS
jgi:hypothetical protein